MSTKQTCSSSGPAAQPGLERPPWRSRIPACAATSASRGNWMADSPRRTSRRARTKSSWTSVSEDVVRYASPWELMGDTTFTTSPAWSELIRMRTWGTGDDRRGDYLRASPCGMVDIIQPLLEPIPFQRRPKRAQRSPSTPSTSVMSKTPTASPPRCAIGWTDGSSPSGRGTWSAPTARDRPGG